MEQPRNRPAQDRALEIYHSPEVFLRISNGDSFTDLKHLDHPHFKLIADGHPALAELQAVEAFGIGFNEAVVEVTHGSLRNLMVVTSGAQADEITRLTFIVNTHSFPMHNSEELIRTLSTALKRLKNLRILTIQLHGKRDREGEKYDVRFFGLERVHRAIYGAYESLRCVPEIRISTNDPTDIIDLRKLSMCKIKSRDERMWYAFRGRFTGLHIFVPRKLLQKSSIQDHIFEVEDCNAALEVMKNTSPLIENLTVNKYPSGGGESDHVHTPFMVHRSTSRRKTRAILRSTREVRHCSIGWIDADAATLVHFIDANSDTLRTIELEVCLKTGTWDQVFAALQNCALSYLSRRGAGLMYSSLAGRLQTGYLTVPRDFTLNPVLRWTDEYELTRLLEQITGVQTLSSLDSFHPFQMEVERNHWVVDTTVAQKENWRGYA